MAAQRRKQAAQRTQAVTTRLSAEVRTRLTATAQDAGISMARLTQVLINFGLDQLARGNPELDRAIKTSRDA